MGTTVLLQQGAWLQFDGELLEVVTVEATRVTLRSARGWWRTVGTAEFLSSAQTAQEPEEPVPSAGLRLAALTAAARKAVGERAAHIRELLTGYRSGTAEDRQPGEPRPEYDPARPLMERHAAKARELGVGERTIRRWASLYEDRAEAGLVDSRMIRGEHTGGRPTLGPGRPRDHGAAGEGIDPHHRSRTAHGQRAPGPGVRRGRGTTALDGHRLPPDPRAHEGHECGQGQREATAANRRPSCGAVRAAAGGPARRVRHPGHPEPGRVRDGAGDLPVGGGPADRGTRPVGQGGHRVAGSATTAGSSPWK